MWKARDSRTCRPRIIYLDLMMEKLMCYFKSSAVQILLFTSAFLLFSEMLGEDQDAGLLFHFKFNENNSSECLDQTGRFKCCIKNKAVQIENGGLRCILPRMSIPVNDKLKITDELTLSVWLAHDYLRKGFENIVFRGDRTALPEQIQFTFSLRSGVPEFKFKDEYDHWQGLVAVGDVYSGTSAKASGIRKKVWTHLAVTFNKGMTRIYINGKCEGECKTKTEKLIPCEAPIIIGSGFSPNSKTPKYFFNGLVNDLRMYEKALDDEKIKAIYQKEKDGYPEKELVLKDLKEIPDFENKLDITKAYEKNIPQDIIRSGKTVACVKNLHGVPGLFVNEKPVFPMMMIPSPYVSGDKIFNSCRDFAAAGVNLYSDLIYSGFGGTKESCTGWWLEEGKYNFSIVDKRLQSIVAANPKAMIMIRIKLDPPKWWCDRNPDEISTYWSGGEYISTKLNYSLASRKWEAAYERMLRDFIRHVERSDYAGHIIGYHPGGGKGGEWNWYGADNGLIDYSKAAQDHFREWVMAKYNNDLAELRKAWSDPVISFENIKPPSPQTRISAAEGVFNDPAKIRPAIDYIRFLNDCVTDNIIKSARICKEETRGEKITCAFYGYSMRNAGSMAVANGGSQGLKKVLESPYIDFLSCPSDYDERNAGDPGPFMSGYNGSYRLHNKLYWDEADIRTHLYNRAEFGRTEDLSETISVLKRAFGYSMTKGTALWWFLLAGNATFHQEEIMQSMAGMEKAGTENLDSDKSSVAQAALIIDEESMYFTSPARGGLVQKLIWDIYRDSLSSGAPCDVYLLSDIADKSFPDYKLYVFMNCFYVPQALKDKIKEKTRKNGAVSVWCYAPGYIDDKGFDDGSNMSDLTGIKLKVESGKKKLTLDLCQKENPIVKKYVENIREAGLPSIEIEPVFYADDPEAEILATSNGKASFVVKKFKDWQSIYSLMPLNKELLQGFCDYARVHVYSRSFDVLSANKSFIMLHNSTNGKKTVSLPGKYDVTELLSGREIGKGITEFTDDFSEQTTRIYKLSEPDAKSFFSRVFGID